MSDLPRELRERLTRKLYASAVDLDWENLGSSEKTAQYARWLADPEIGGELTCFLPDASARLWIKDGPMKEYARARFGVGPFAHLLDTPRCTPETVVAAALGKEWQVVGDSVRLKPARCLATGPAGTALVMWGNTSDFKHLVWAGLEIVADAEDRQATIAVVESPARPTSKADRGRQKKIADRCGFVVRHINPTSGRAPSPQPTSVAAVPSDGTA